MRMRCWKFSSDPAKSEQMLFNSGKVSEIEAIGSTRRAVFAAMKIPVAIVPPEFKFMQIWIEGASFALVKAGQKSREFLLTAHRLASLAL